MSSAEHEAVARDPRESPGSSGDSEDTDMMERDLAEDAQWKRIQQNTFTRWANEHLKKACKTIMDLETDLSDGLLLIQLIEVLSGKQMPRYNKKPVFRSQKLENVSVALKFLERESIRIVNIDSTHIVDSKLKLILGLIWTLILHYSISIPMLEREGDGMNGGQNMTPKERLMNWIQNKLSDLPIRNFTKDWKDGKAVGALVDACAPGLCPDWQDWNPQDAVKNASEAMGLADDWLDVRQLIKPQEMVSPDIDEQSMMTYLSQYPAAQLKPGAPMRPRANPNWVRTFGPGIEPTGNIVGVATNFTVETVNAGRGKVEVAVISPDGQHEPVTIKFNDDSNMTYQVSYKPRVEGLHSVEVKFAGKPIQKSPFKVGVSSKAGDPSKVTASGPGLNPTGNLTNQNTYFDIFANGAGDGMPEVVILDPQGHRGTVPVQIRPKSNDVWRAEYSTPNPGLHSVNVFFNGKPIPNSPFGVQIAPVSDPKKVRVTGRGVQPEGIRARDVAQFYIYTDGAGEGTPDATILGPGGSKVPVTLKKLSDNKYEAVYNPDRVGPYVVIVTFANQEVPGSPFKVKVSPMETSNKIKAFGPGLKGGIVNHPACCTVVRNGEAGALGVRIEGPSQAVIECVDNHDGSADVRYVVSAPGDYAVHILCDNEHIPGSPFLAEFISSGDVYPDKVEVTGSGVEPTGVKVASPTKFIVNTKQAGKAPLDVEVLDEDLNAVPVRTTDNMDGTYTCQYTPNKATRHSVQVNYGGVAVKKSPFHVKVAQNLVPNDVLLYGEGVGDNIRSGVPVSFAVDCTKAGQGDLSMGLVSSKGSNVELRAKEDAPGVYQVSYVAPHPGDYTLNVQYGGVPAAQCPKTLRVLPGISESDLKNIKVLGLEKAVPVNSLQQFRVLTQGARKAEFAVAITSPSGFKVKAHIVPTHEGYLVNFTPTELGEYLLGLTFGGEPLTAAPYKVTCTYGYDSGKVRATGPGLERGTVGEPAQFLIDTRGAGQGGLGVTVEGPCEAAINCRDNGDGTCSVAYLPTEPGDYAINIAFNDQHIHGSPFQAVITPFLDLESIKVFGDGIQPNGVYCDCPTDIWVDSRGLGNGHEEKQVTCQITNPSGKTTDTIVTPFQDGTYQVTYTPFEEGEHKIEILYDGLPVPGSPFIVSVQKGLKKDSNETRAFGPGLVKGVVGKKNRFTILHDGATKMKMEAQGPSTPRVSAKDNRNGTFDAEYEADVPGTYAFYLKTDGKNIEGSPFIVPVEENEDVVLAGVYGPALEKRNCYKNVPFQFFVRGYEPGVVTVKSSTETGPTSRQPSVKNNGDGTYTVTVYPPQEGENLDVQVAFNGKPIPKGPYKWKIVDALSGQKVKLKGRGIESLSVPASVPVGFTVDTRKAGSGEVAVNVTGPNGEPVQMQIEDGGDGVYDVMYLPEECGPYSIGVKYADCHVTPYSPAVVNAVPSGCAARCKIVEGVRSKVTCGEEYCISVDAQEAGHGNITCNIRSTLGNDVNSDVVDNRDGTFTIYYSIKDTGEYTLKILFGGVPVPGGVYTIKVTSEDSKEPEVNSQKAKESASATSKSKETTFSRESSSSVKFREVCFDKFPLPSTGGHASAEVKMPSGNVDKPIIEDNRDGTVSIKYGPKEEGLHELYIKYNGEHVQGSPYKFHVDSISSGYVTAYGSGLTHGVCGEPANFTITTKGAGTGGLTMAIEGPSKADISCHDNKDGTVSVSYLPTAPGEYKISVKFSDKHIKGSPYSAKITGEGRKRNQISVSSCSEVSLPGKVTDSDIRAFNASIQSPSGLEEPCYLKLLPNGNLCVSFTPRMPGEHQVSVKRMGKHIKNSPFKINVAEMEVGDARKVKVTGAIKEGKTHIENFLNVDTKSAGFGGLSLSIEGPSKTEIACRDNEDGTLQISYKPTEPGYYIVNLKFADHHVIGSPFTVKVSGEGSNRVREKIQRQREAVPVTEVGSQCKLTFKMPGITSFDLSATVTSPGGVTEDAEINEVEDGLYAVHFVPKELGVHTVCVKYKDIHIPGSPFQFTVGPLKDGGAHRVHAGGPGLERGEQGQPCEFNVWTREAGAGSLAISVEGPSKAQIDYKDRKDGSCYVSYIVTEPGEYRIGIKFNDQHIPDSPYKVYISPAMGDAHKLEVAQFPESGVKADQPSSFLVRKNGAKGELDAKIVSPSGVEDDCFIQSIDSDTYSVRFMPRENAIHNIHLKFNGVHIPGSPYRIKVGKEDADPAAVHASGNGLREIKTGIKTDFMVDTCNAGSGTLAVTIDGPSKVAMDCTEIEEGYKVRYTPLSPGDYYVSVKYNGYHIVGSPYKVSCIGDNLADSGAQETSSVVVETVTKVSKNSRQGPVLPLFKSDASKVTSKGMGLKKAYLQKQNMFTVHCGDAGTNILYVGIHGPKGPCDEVFIKHMGRNNFQVNYVVRERGDYILIVRWGDEHIPGSPFKVDV